jgi:hypothetical protein
MNNMHALLFSSVVSIGSFVMAADSASAHMSTSQKFVYFHVHCVSMAQGDSNFIKPYAVCEDDPSPLSVIKHRMIERLNQKGHRVDNGCFLLTDENRCVTIFPDHSLKIAELDQYKPYGLLFVIEKL